MKKILIFLITFLSLVSVITTDAYAENEYELNGLKDEVSDGIFSAMEDEVAEALFEIGITDLDFSGVYNLSFSEILSYFTPEIKSKAVNVLKSLTGTFSVMLLYMLFSTLLYGDEREKTFELLMTALIAVIVMPMLRNTIAPAVSVMKITNSFIVSYIPVLTLILSFSGSGASAVLFNTSVVGICELMSFIINGVLVDFIGLFICVVTAFSMNDSMRASRIISAVNRLFTVIMTSAGALFSGILTVKNVMAASVDSLSVRGIRFVLSSFIPVIGSSISEAYSSVLGSINLIKGSAVVIGILAVAIINVPVIAELFMYYISFSALGYFSEICCTDKASGIFRMCASVTRIFMALIIFEIFILVISTGLIITIKNS